MKLFKKIEEIYPIALLEHQIGYFCVDILVGDFVIEVDGDFWHANPVVQGDKPLKPVQQKNLANDRRKDGYIAARGMTMIRVWENDINKNIDCCIARIRGEIDARYL